MPLCENPEQEFCTAAFAQKLRQATEGTEKEEGG